MAGIAVMGGAGFIGSHVSERLVKSGHEVTVLDLAPVGKESGIPFVRGDVFNEETLTTAMRSHDTVINLVGLPDIGECQREPAQSFRLNVEASARILEAARLTDVRRVVFPSSAAVYGKVETVPIDETAIPNPANLYGWHKLMAELNHKAYWRSYGLHYVVLRLFNVIGHGNAGVIHHYVNSAVNDGRIRGFGRDQLRDFVDAKDAANAFYLAATHPEVMDKTINVGSGEGVRIEALARMVQDAVPGTRLAFEEKSGYIPYHSVADITLARTLLGFDPEPASRVVRRFIEELVNDDR